MSQNLEASQKTFERAITVQEQALRASNRVSYLLAKSKKAHTVAEELILSCAIDMCTAHIGRDGQYFYYLYLKCVFQLLLSVL